jgi:hypothetical protein
MQMEVAGMKRMNYENKLERWAGRMLLLQLSFLPE